MLTETGSLPKVGYLSDDNHDIYDTFCYKTFEEGSDGIFSFSKFFNETNHSIFFEIIYNMI